MVFYGKLLASFDATVNVQSVAAAATLDRYGKPSAYDAVRAILVREEQVTSRVPDQKGEARSTSHRWMSTVEIKPTDRLWLSADSSATPDAAPSASKLQKARRPASVTYLGGPGAHWEVDI